MTEQTRPNGTLRHLLTLEGMTHGADRSAAHPRAEIREAHRRTRRCTSKSLAGVTVANMFTEPSTRTRVSFELAAKRLGADVVNLEVQLSSRVKGESMLDTIYTLEACHVDVFVIRDAEAGVPGIVASHVQPHASVLSAGEAHVAHPTQGLLDALTILQAKKKFDGLKIAIVGDVKHSRVARSAWHVLATLGVAEIRIVAPRASCPRPANSPAASAHTSHRRRHRRRRRHHDVAHPEGAHGHGRDSRTPTATSRSSACPRSAWRRRSPMPSSCIRSR